MTSPSSSLIYCGFLVLTVLGIRASEGSDGPTSGHFLHTVQMDQQGNYIMRWTPYEDYIDIQLEVATHGYVGLGFSPNGGMKGADIIMGWVDGKGIPHISDRYAIGQMTPVVDASQDVELVNGWRNVSHTTLRFRRLWDTCDEEHDMLLTSSTTRVIWAYADEAPKTTESTRLSYHRGQRGQRSLYLKVNAPPTVTRDRDVQHWDVLAPNVSLPNDVDTMYWCKLYKMPTLRQKHHYIGYEPVIEPRMLPFVHHMLLYECHGTDTEKHLEQWVDEVGAQCYYNNMPQSWDACNMPIVSWAAGSQGFSLPEHTGFPLGEEHSGATYFMLEIHYNNPTMIRDLVDNSGMRLFYTPRLRQYDAGVIQFGHQVDPFLIIPPGREWISTSHCTADCTRLTLPQTGIQVFSGMLHAHLLGRAIKLQHIRRGRELPTLVQDEHYDFNYQQERVLPEERNVLPGDHLIVTCKYDSTKKTSTTYGGFKTTEEMCLVYVSYYPKQKLAECFSRPDIAMMLDTLGVQDMEDNTLVLNMFTLPNFKMSNVNVGREAQKLKKMRNQTEAGQSYTELKLSNYLHILRIAAPPELKGRTLLEFLDDGALWQHEAMVKTLQERVARGQYEPHCALSGRGIPEGMPKKGKYPPYLPYEAPKAVCHSENNFNSGRRNASLGRPSYDPRDPLYGQNPPHQQDIDLTVGSNKQPEHEPGNPLFETNVAVRQHNEEQPQPNSNNYNSQRNGGSDSNRWSGQPSGNDNSRDGQRDDGNDRNVQPNSSGNTRNGERNRNNNWNNQPNGNDASRDVQSNGNGWNEQPFNGNNPLSNSNSDAEGIATNRLDEDSPHDADIKQQKEQQQTQQQQQQHLRIAGKSRGIAAQHIFSNYLLYSLGIVHIVLLLLIF